LVSLWFIHESFCIPEKNAEDGSAESVKSSESSKKSRKAKQLRVLDGKQGQSLSILLGSVSDMLLPVFSVTEC